MDTNTSSTSTLFEHNTFLAGDSYDSALGNPFMREMTNDITDNTYIFLQKKLTDSNETIASYSEREAKLKCDIDRISIENEDLIQAVASLTNKCVITDETLQGELRARYSLQDQIKEKDAVILDQKKHLTEMENKVASYENKSMKFQEFIRTSFKCKETLVNNAKEMNEVLEKSKTVIKMLQGDKTELTDRLAVLSTDFENHEGIYEELTNEVDLLKHESAQQEAYIKRILDSFKELDLHFKNMKTYYNLQKAKVDAAQKEILEKCSKEETLKGDAITKMNEMENYKKQVQENEKELTRRIGKLEETLDSMIKIRHQLEETNKTFEKGNQELREEKIETKGMLESLEKLLNVEKQKSHKAERYVEHWMKKYDDCQNELQESQDKVRILEMDVNTLNVAKSKSEENVYALEEKHSRLHNVVTSLDSDNKLLSEENITLSQKFKEIENEIKSLSSEREETEQCLKERFQQITNLKEELSKLTAEHQHLTQENKERRCKLEVLERTCQEHESKIESSGEQLKHCQLIFMENDENFQEVAAKLKLAEQENSDKGVVMEKMSHTLLEMKTAYDTTLQTAENLKGLLHQRESEMHLLQKDKEIESVKLGEDVKRITMVVQKQNKEHEQQNKRKEEVINTLSTKLKQLVDIVDADEVQITQLHQRINFLTSKNEELNKELSSVSDKRDELFKNINNLEKEKVKLSENFREVKGLLTEKTAELQRFNEEAESLEKLWNKQQTQSLHELQVVLSTPTRNILVTTKKARDDVNSPSIWEEM